MIYRRTSDGLDGFRRKRLAIPTTSVPASEGTVYFLAGDYDSPAGGIRVLYRHVDILNEAGIPASVLHRSRGFRCTWFENATRVADTVTTAVSPSDLLVASELDVDLLAGMPRGVAHAVFNQGVHLTWKREAARVTRHYLECPDLKAIVTASAHSVDLLRHAFPGIPVERVHLGVDAAIFHPGKGERPKRIGYMPRRGSDDADATLEILRARGALRDWEVVPLYGLSHAGVGDALRQLRIFLSFARQEGFGLPSAEAMACGAYVIGYDGFGGREHFHPGFSYPVGAGDVLGMAQAIEEILDREEVDPGWCTDMGRKASIFVLETYSQQRETDDVVSLYSRLLGSGRGSVVAGGKA